MMESMSRFGRGIGRHPMPIPHSEDSETDEYNVIDSDRQYERIGDRGSSSTGTSSSRSSNIGAMVDPLIAPSSHLHTNSHMFHHRTPGNPTGTLGKVQGHPHNNPLTTHYAESAIYRRSRGIGSPNESEPPLIPESQHFMAGSTNGGATTNNNNNGALMDNSWKSQHSTLEFSHLSQLPSHQQQQLLQSQQAPNTTILSALHDASNASSATTTTSVYAGAPNAPVYESACLMRTASGSLYIPSDNKGAFHNPKPPLQSINEFTIGGTLKKPDRLPSVGANHSHFGRPIATHLNSSRFPFRKVLSVQCNWKYLAIAFMLITMALVIAITYIMSTAFSVANLSQQQNGVNCPVAIEDIFELTAGQQPQHQTGPGNNNNNNINIGTTGTQFYPSSSANNPLFNTKSKLWENYYGDGVYGVYGDGGEQRIGRSHRTRRLLALHVDDIHINNNDNNDNDYLHDDTSISYNPYHLHAAKELDKSKNNQEEEEGNIVQKKDSLTALSLSSSTIPTDETETEQQQQSETHSPHTDTNLAFDEDSRGALTLDSSRTTFEIGLNASTITDDYNVVDENKVTDNESDLVVSFGDQKIINSDDNDDSFFVEEPSTTTTIRSINDERGHELLGQHLDPIEPDDDDDNQMSFNGKNFSNNNNHNHHHPRTNSKAIEHTSERASTTLQLSSPTSTSSLSGSHWPTVPSVYFTNGSTYNVNDSLATTDQGGIDHPDNANNKVKVEVEVKDNEFFYPTSSSYSTALPNDLNVTLTNKATNSVVTDISPVQILINAHNVRSKIKLSNRIQNSSPSIISSNQSNQPNRINLLAMFSNDIEYQQILQKKKLNPVGTKSMTTTANSSNSTSLTDNFKLDKLESQPSLISKANNSDNLDNKNCSRTDNNLIKLDNSFNNGTIFNPNYIIGSDPLINTESNETKPNPRLLLRRGKENDADKNNILQIEISSSSSIANDFDNDESQNTRIEQTKPESYSESNNLFVSNKNNNTNNSSIIDNEMENLQDSINIEPNATGRSNDNLMIIEKMLDSSMMNNNVDEDDDMLSISSDNSPTTVGHDSTTTNHNQQMNLEKNFAKESAWITYSNHIAGLSSDNYENSNSSININGAVPAWTNDLIENYLVRAVERKQKQRRHRKRELIRKSLIRSWLEIEQAFGDYDDLQDDDESVANLIRQLRLVDYRSDRNRTVNDGKLDDNNQFIGNRSTRSQSQFKNTMNNIYEQNPYQNNKLHVYDYGDNDNNYHNNQINDNIVNYIINYKSTTKTKTKIPKSNFKVQTLSSHHHVPSATSLSPASPTAFTNVQQLGRIYSQRVPSLGYWYLRYHQAEASLIKFNVSFPSTLAAAPVLAIYGNREKAATHTRYDFVEFIGRVAMPAMVASSTIRAKRSGEYLSHTLKMTSIQKEFTKYLDTGVWFFTFFNDAPFHVDLSFDLTLANEESCLFNCHGHGVCIAGQCKCDSGYNGESCDLMTCPVLCSGRGQYSSGECVCNSGWKGKECHIRDDDCEIANCNGHGDCMDGTCHCFPGYKGEHCENVDCLDSKCSGHGHCVSGVCLCSKNWKGADCSEPDTETSHCLPDCSGHGNFDQQLQQCICDERWTGSECSQERCDLDCGPNGHCEGGECICDEGWTGEKCMTRLCDPRCLEHGQCQNGTCICAKGWNGKHCSLEGCLNGCSRHGECIHQGVSLDSLEEEWACDCETGFAGVDCSVPLESQCGDNIDNDKDGLVDCADPECCQSKECEGKQLCFSASDPQDILLRKQPPAMTASFYQRMQFLIEEESVQSYAHKMSFNDSIFWNRINESRASVIRGQIVDFGGLGITGVRVGVSTDPMLGFTLTRENGWFDLMVNGGGSITLHLQRDPFKPTQKVVNVPVNEIVVLDKIVLTLDGHGHNNDHDGKKSTICSDHDYDKMRPIVVATWKQPFQNGHSADKSAVLVESQIVQESIRIPATDVNLVYHSSRSSGFLSTIELQLTPDKIEPSLRLVHLKIAMEGILFEKTFEADPNILYTYAWNRRNVYRQKVYGLANAVIHVGYQYINCQSPIWEVQTVQLAGHDMPISEIGGWNLDVHHRYNFHEGILQKGDGSNLYLKQKAKLLTTSIGDGQQRPLHCPYCNGVAKDQRLLAPVALASGPDGSLYIGDFNLVRRLKTDGTISTVVELSESSVAYKYHLAVGPIDGKLYFSDPEKHQILRAINLDTPSDPRTNLEVFVGTGVKCLPGDRTACGDGRSARDAKLSYPKGIVIAPTGELYLADGTNIRMVDTFGVIHTLIGDHYHKSHWKPIPCAGSTPISKLTLRWPTQLAISPLDQSLHILDDHMVLKVTPDKRVIIVAGRPSHCPSYGHHRHSADSDDKKDQSDSKDAHATQVFLETPQSISFGPNGDLYIAESDSQNTNRVRVVSIGDQRISRFAGADINCSCMDIACQCFSPDDLLAVNARLSTISSIAITPDGRVHISDQENLRVRTVYSPLPPQNPSTGEYEIVWPDSSKVYVFNRHGQHIMTKSALSGTLLYTFAYNVNTINGRISSVTDSAGNKVYILRDYSSQVKSIENSQGDKCQLSMTRQGLLASFTTPSNYAIKFNYKGNTDALLTSRIDSWGKSTLYKYDEYGRVVQTVLPTGDVLRIQNRLAFDGTKRLTVTYNDRDFMRFDVSDKDISKYVTDGDETYTLERISSVTPSSKGSQRKLAIRKRDTSHLEIESLNSPVIADAWPKMSELWPLPSMMRVVFNSENIRRLEWRYFVKRNSANAKSVDLTSSTTKKPTVSSIGRKLKLNGNTVFSIEYDKEAHQQILFDHSNRPILHMSYDSVGRPIKFVSNFNLTPVSLDYDRYGRLLSWTRGALSLNMDYDIKGRVTNVKHADSSNTVLKYADTTLGPTEITRPSGSRYLLQYDANGGITAIMTPAGHRYELYRQVSLGFYKLLFLPSGFYHPFTLQYDDWGRVILKLLPNNSGRKVISYNSFGQIETELCGSEKTEYIYHLGSTLLKSVNKASSDNYDYRVDYRHQGSLLKEERFRFNSRSELSNYKLRYKYDGVGHINEVEFELQGRGVETRKYKFSSSTGAEEGIDAFIFKRHSANVVQIGDERSLKTIATDSYGRVVGITLSVWNKELYSQVIRYEERRSRIAESRIKYGLNYMQSNYSYTLDGYLEQASTLGTVGSSNAATSQQFKYIYDIDGNVKTIYDGETQLVIRRDEAGRARGFGENSEDVYTVDERGFVISRGATKYVWNADGLLISAIIKDSGVETVINYHYDHKNRLMSRFVSNSGNNKNRTQFIYDESKPVISYCVVDSRIIGFVYDTNDHLIALSIEGTKYYVASDHLGSPVAVYTSDGVMVKEIVRNIWGVTIKDSNPSFWLPIDFQGSIRDPLTGLSFFDDGRAYDAAIGQWLTPNWEAFGESLQNIVHLYRFFNNDPINSAKSVRHFDGDYGLLPMANINSWLETLGYRMNFIFEDQKSKQDHLHVDQNIQRSPLETTLSSESRNLYSQFTHLSMIPESKIKVSMQSSDIRNNFLRMHEMLIATMPSTLNAVLISRTPKVTNVYSVENDKNPMINAVITSVFNGTYSLPFQLVHHSKDEFFFIRPSTSDFHNRMQRDIEQLHKLGSLVNVSRVTENDSSGTPSSTSTSHILISSGNLLLNIRYGVTYDEEVNRVARMARRKAVQEAWQREVYYLRHGFPGMIKSDWSPEERKNLLHTGMVREYFGSDIHGIERYAQLADDPTNVRFRRESSSTNLLNRKRRNHSHRQKQSNVAKFELI